MKGLSQSKKTINANKEQTVSTYCLKKSCVHINIHRYNQPSRLLYINKYISDQFRARCENQLVGVRSGSKQRHKAAGGAEQKEQRGS